MRTFIGAVPFSALALAATVVIAWAGSGVLARWLRTDRAVAALLLFGFGFVLSATLMPTAAALQGEVSDGICDTSRVGFASIDQLTRVNFTTLNVILFVPLGIAVGSLPISLRAALVALAAASLTLVVETIQLLVPTLGRGCEVADVFDNLLGLAVGLVVGLLVRLYVGRS